MKCGERRVAVIWWRALGRKRGWRERVALRDNDVEPETRRDCTVKRETFCLSRGGMEKEGEVRRSFLLLSTSISQCFPRLSLRTSPLFPFKRLSLHLPLYMWQKAFTYTHTYHVCALTQQKKGCRLPMTTIRGSQRFSSTTECSIVKRLCHVDWHFFNTAPDSCCKVMVMCLKHSSESALLSLNDLSLQMCSLLTSGERSRLLNSPWIFSVNVSRSRESFESHGPVLPGQRNHAGDESAPALKEALW